MSLIVVLLGLIMCASGSYEIYFGNSYISVERGWSAFISGTVLLTGGLVVIAIGVAIRAVTDLRRSLTAAAPAVIEPPFTAPADFASTPAAESAAAALPVAAVAPAGDQGLSSEPVLDFQAGRDIASPPVQAEPQPASPAPFEPASAPARPKRELFGRPKAKREPALDIPQFDPAPIAEPPATPAAAAAIAPSAVAAVDEPASEQRVPAPHNAFDPPADDWLDRSFADLDREVADLYTPAADATHPRLDSSMAADEATHSAAFASHPERAEAVQASAEPAQGHAENEAQPGESQPTDSAVIGRYEADGTTYVMYADGSIEAQSEAGVYRFASMAELRSFIEG